MAGAHPILQHPVEDLKVDNAFVLAPEHRPKHSYDSYIFTTDRIPLIDLSSLWESPRNEDRYKNLVEEAGRACEQWGFFQVINHGIPHSLIENVTEEAKAFFALPLDEKRKQRRTFDNPLGYYDGELTENVRDWKEIFEIAANGQLELPVDSPQGDKGGVAVYTNRWPAKPSGFGHACEKYAAAAQELAFSLLEVVSQSLGLPPEYFHHYFTPQTSLLRLNHYPPCPSPELVLGTSRHKDLGALTLLGQDDVGGLEVRRKDGEWIGVEPNVDAFVINVGDVMQVWSNGKYESVEHRVVVNQNKDRYSYVLSFRPAHSADIAPVANLIDETLPVRYQPFNWGKYSKRRQASNFRNLGAQNLQISSYAIKE